MKGHLCQINLRELQLRPCQGCGHCDRTGRCVFDDDISRVYDQINRAKGLILISPIYFGSLSAQMKIFIDRGQAPWAAKERLGYRPPVGRKGYFIAVAGWKDRERFFVNAREIVEIWYRCLGIESRGEAYFSGYDERGAIAKDPRALDRAYAIGEGLQNW